MADRTIRDLDIKIKLTKEYLENGGYEKIPFVSILNGLKAVRTGNDGKVDPNTVSVEVNAFMLSILASHLTPPYFSDKHVSEYQSTLQKGLFFERQNIDTEKQFDEIYEEFKNKEDVLFRGQREAKWRLYSRLQRQWIIEELYSSSKSYQTLLEDLVLNGNEAYAGQIRELLKDVNVDSENDIGMLGFLQHYGCPTPLLDWTFNFRVGLYFGLDGLLPKEHALEIEDYFSVYYLEEEYFNGGSMRKIMQDSLDTIGKQMMDAMITEIASTKEIKDEMTAKFAERSFFDKSRFSGSGLVKHMTTISRMVNFPITYFSDRDIESGIIFSLNNNRNILNQSGVFTWNSDAVKPLEMVGNEQFAHQQEDITPEDYRFCRCFNINKGLENYIRGKLEEDGITAGLIYPTPEISSYEIFEKSKNA